MLGRLSLCNFYTYNKSIGHNLKLKYGDHAIRTHQSHIKNMNMYFRSKRKVECSKISPLYTIENSCKNWTILREMVKVIIMEGLFLKMTEEA